MQFDDDIASNWHYPSEIFFGRNEISHLGERLQALNSVNPLFVVDKGLLELPAIVDCLSAGALAAALHAARAYCQLGEFFNE